jgi:archaellum component FlaC
LKNETTDINEDIMKVSYDVSNMKNHIKEVNKMIAGVCKEKDGVRCELNVLKKQIKLIRTKVNEMYNKNANFMLNVNQLIEDNQLENTLNI